MSKKEISGIYCILNRANGKRYIGSSKSVHYRWKQQHKPDLKNNKHGNQHLQNAWNKYGESNFEFLILEECSIDVLEIKEEYWLDQFKSYERQCGYNLTKICNGKHIISEETKEKMSQSWQNSEIREKRIEAIKNSITPEIRKKHSDYAKQQYQDPEYVAKKSERMSNTWKEKGNEMRQKMKDSWENNKAQRIEAITDEGRQRMSEASKEYWISKATPILQYDLKGNFIKEWTLQMDAVREYGVHVNSVLKGHRKHTRGYIFRYK